MKKAVMLALAGLGLTGLSNPVSAQAFGNSVSIGDGEIIVGEPVWDMRSGVVYVFEQDAAGEWALSQRLEPAEGQATNRFGIRTALQDDVLLVSATRVDGGTGGVYVYEKDGGLWQETGRLDVDDRSPADSLGSGLAIDGDWVMIGTVAQNEARGAAYAFRRDGDGWVQHSKLVPSDLAPVDRFGSTVAMGGGWAMIAAPAKDQGAGAVYVYQYDVTADQWQERGKLQAPGVGQQTGMGTDIEIRDGFALVSAPGFFAGTGIVFSFEVLENTWQLTSLLTPFHAEAGGAFGTSIQFDGQTAWFGAPGAGFGAGRVFMFDRDPETGEWLEARKLGGDVAQPGESFAATVAVGGSIGVSAALGADYSAGAAYVFERGADGWTATGRLVGEVMGMDAVLDGEVTCTEDGTAAAFGCESVDLVSFLPMGDMDADRGVIMNDVWGWTDPETGREIALAGMSNQLVFIDLTNPGRPAYLGRLPMTEGAIGSVWRDMKVYDNHMYVVSDNAGAHGMQIFDLTRLRGLDGSDPQTFDEDAIYTGINSAHNIVINEESGFAYAVGASGGGETCGGGLHMIDIRNPTSPTFAGCFADAGTGRQRTGYSHDAQCIIYRGPDADHTGSEICFGANETALSIADVTDKSSPVALSVATYPNVAYSHQGWVSEDHAWFFMNDELDESGGLTDKTRTLVWDISDLDDPVLATEHFSESSATDHNLYIRGNIMYQSNYVSGLRVVDISDPANPVNVGHFDTVPYVEDTPEMEGSWSNYPYFESGNIIVTSQKEGLFVVRYRPRSIS